jgi:hypothetical protein
MARGTSIFGNLIAAINSATGNPEDLKSTNGAGHVTDGVIGIARNRWCNVAHNTLPVLATSGVVTFANPGVRGVSIDSVYLVAGPVPLTTTNWRIRYAIDSVNDAADAILLPIAEPGHSAALDVGQVRSFNVTPILIPDTEVAGDLRIVLLTLPKPVIVSVENPIKRLSFVHNLGAGVTVQLGISSVEVLS